MESGLDIGKYIVFSILIIGIIIAMLYNGYMALADIDESIDEPIDYTKVDKEIYRLVRLLNCIPYLHTICSCSGHDKELVRIWFVIPAKKVNFVMYYFFNNMNTDDWNICIETADPNLKSDKIVLMLESKRVVSKMKNEITAMCDNILCIMIETGFKLRK